MPKLDPSALKPGERAAAKAWLKDRHKFVTGYCNNINKIAQCEGTKPTSDGTEKGKPLPTCSFWLECPCDCHYHMDEIFKITGMERREMPNAAYVPEVVDFVMPEVEDPIGSGVAVDADGMTTPPDVERPVAAPAGPPAAPLAERRTPTGRAARGGLEAQVWEACRVLDADPITPKAVAEWIAEKWTIPTPSTGAVNAVWDRWTKLGFATQGKKPNRFTGFTGEGTWEELARMKVSAKVKKRSQASALQRGIRT